METRNRRHEQRWQLCTCHGLSMSHGRSGTGQIPLTLLLTELSMGKLKTQTQAQANSHPSARRHHMGLLKETQPSESKALRSLKRQHPDSFNVFRITELTLNPETHENSSDAESQPIPENKGGSACLFHHPRAATLVWVHVTKPQNGLTWKGPLKII